MAYSLIAHGQSRPSIGNPTLPLNCTGANLFVAVASGRGTLAVSDSLSNTWSIAVSDFSVSGNGGAIFYCLNPTVGASQTFNTLSGSFDIMNVTAWSGAAASSVLGPTNFADTLTGSTFQPGSVTPTSNGSLIVSGIGSNNTGTITIDTGFTVSDQASLNAGVSFGLGQGYLI